MTPGELLTSQVTAPAATVDEDIIIIVDVVEIIAAVAIVVEAPDEGTVVALPSVVVVVVERVVVVVEVVVVEVVVEVAYSISVLVLLTLLQAASTHTQSVQPSVKSQLCSAGLSFTPQPRAVWLVAVSATDETMHASDVCLQYPALGLTLRHEAGVDSVPAVDEVPLVRAVGAEAARAAALVAVQTRASDAQLGPGDHLLPAVTTGEYLNFEHFQKKYKLGSQLTFKDFTIREKGEGPY